MKNSILFFIVLIVFSSGFFSFCYPFYSSYNMDEKNNISITVTCGDEPLDSVKVIILEDEIVIGSGWTNSQGVSNILIDDVSGQTVNIKAIKKGYESFFLKGGLLSSSTSFQINMHHKTDNPKSSNFLEFKLEKEDIKQPL